MEISEQVKNIKIEDVKCGVMSLSTGSPCNLEAFSLITIDEHNAVLCVCEKHALSVFTRNEPVIVREIGEGNRYFGVEFSSVPEVG